jgi:predicted enzyme involved in methoxymalonyl-ACP biosynthesis
MEEFTLNTIVETAKKNGFKKLIGEYIESPKNQMVQNHYENLGFKTENGKWILEIADYQPSEVNIKTKNN